MRTDIRVLVVDDDVVPLTLMEHYLRVECGLTNLVYRMDGLDAYETLVEQGGFDLVLTDWNMAKMNGVEFTERVRRNRSLPQPVIIMTSSMGNATEAFTAGVDGYMMKPVSLADLKEKLEQFFPS